MCGIAGFFNFDGSPANAGVLARMVEIQHHRGPDDHGMRVFSLASGKSSAVPFQEGMKVAESFEGALGFNRLSILDLSAEGHQPMCNADASVFIAFNGEIYNAFSFKSELEAAGFRFRSRTDTEVILYLFERYGFDGMLQRLNGMFAIVIVDLRKGEISIARDHFGIKPFYWAQVGATLMFASEVKALLQHPAFRPQLDEECLDEYLAFRYCAGDRFLLKGVHQLRPGHCMRVSREGAAVRRYWEIPDPEKLQTTFRYAASRLDDLMRNSVKSQLISDVRIGAQLSGGIDSSLVSANARMHLAAPLDTFSIIFEDQDYSEKQWIDQVVELVGATSHQFSFSEDDFFSSLDSASWHLDQPLNHPNSLGIFQLARRAREFVTVLLSGEGADELFGGYPRHYYAAIRSKIVPWLSALGRLPQVGERFSRNFGRGHDDPANAFIASSMFMQPSDIARLRPSFNLSRLIEMRREIFLEGHGDHLDNCLKYDMQTYMVDLLVRQDKMTMAHSMENRVPYLDLPLVNFVRSLPSSFSVGSGLALRSTVMRNTKIILKSLARKYFDDRFVFRSKSGFGLPLTKYYSSEQFDQLMHDRLMPAMRGRGLVSERVVLQKWRSLLAGGDRRDETFWIPVALELWAQQFLDVPQRELGAAGSN